MPRIFIPADDMALIASIGRACAANVNAPRPDHRPPRRRKEPRDAR